MGMDLDAMIPKADEPGRQSTKQIKRGDEAEKMKTLKALKKASKDRSGKKDVTGEPMPQITSEMLQTSAGLSSEEAQELLWVADCYDKGPGETVDFKMIAAAVFTSNAQQEALPPLPVMPERRDIRVDMFPEADSKLVVDIRNLKDTNALVEQMRLAGLHNFNMMKYDSSLDGAPEVVSEASDASAVETSEKAEKPKTFKQKARALLEDPSSSDGAQLLSVIIGVLIVFNVTVMVIEPIVRDEDATDTEDQVWFGIELAFTIIFFIEYLARLWAANAYGATRLSFIKCPLNMCDLCALLPLFLDLAISAMSGEDENNSTFRLLRVTRLTRLARVVRMGRLAKASASFAPIAVIFVVIWGIYLKSGM